jgi:hypothetical protein
VLKIIIKNNDSTFGIQEECRHRCIAKNIVTFHALMSNALFKMPKANVGHFFTYNRD